MSTAENWKSAREAAGLSAAEAGRLIGVHENTIYGLEKKADKKSVELMRKVAAIYGVSLGQIFGDNEKPRVPVEFRPLADVLSPLTQKQREKIIRNIASSLSFFSMIYGAAKESAEPSLDDTDGTRRKLREALALKAKGNVEKMRGRKA